MCTLYINNYVLKIGELLISNFGTYEEVIKLGLNLKKNVFIQFIKKMRVYSLNF